MSQPLSIKQRIALAIKAKQKAAQPNMPSQPEMFSAPQTSMFPIQSVKSPFNIGAKIMNPKFFKLKQKLTKI